MITTYEIVSNTNNISKARGVKPDKKEVKDAIIQFVSLSKREKEIKEEKEKYANILRKFVKNIRDFFASRGDFVKTYRIEHKELETTYAVDVSASDRYSLPKRKEDMYKLKKEIGSGIFDQLFEETLTIKIKDIIANDPRKRRELTKILIDALGEEKVKEYFVKENNYETKEDFREKIYQLTEEQKNILFKYVKFPEDYVKDVSY